MNIFYASRFREPYRYGSATCHFFFLHRPGYNSVFENLDFLKLFALSCETHVSSKLRISTIKKVIVFK